MDNERRALCINHAERLTAVETGLETTNDTLKTIDKKLDGVTDQLSRQKGFIAGVGFAFTCMAAIVAAIISKLLSNH